MHHTTTSLVTTSTQLRTSAETTTTTPPSCASSQIPRSAQRGTNADVHTIESRDSTTKISIRQSFVTATLTKFNSASTETTVHSPTRWKILKCDSSTIYSLVTKTSTSTSSTLRLNGVPIIMSITKHNVCTRITSRISEENQICSAMIPSSAKTGSPVLLLPATKRDAKDWKNVPLVTAGKNNNFTH